jgi:hypothetical protein
MVFAHGWSGSVHPKSPGLHRLVAVLTVIGWLLLAGLIASFYVGHSPGPYGMCSTPAGRSVSCALLRR